MNTEEFMRDKYASLTMNEKLKYWGSELNFQHRMQCEAAEGIGNIGLYLMNTYSKEYLLPFENNWNSFEKEFCKAYHIDLEIGRILFDLDTNSALWRATALKVGLNPKYP